MPKIRGETQVIPGTLTDNLLKSSSMTDILRLLQADGDSIITRDPDNNVVSVTTHLANGDIRHSDISRNSDGSVASIHTYFETNSLTKTYNILRGPDGSVASIDEV